MEVTKGVIQCHRLNIIHCDIKPQNILVKDGRRTVKLTDFGLAKLGKRGSVFGGTPGYIAPEIYRCLSKPDHHYGEKIDEFSLVAVCYRIMMEEDLIKDKNDSSHEVVNPDPR